MENEETIDDEEDEEFFYEKEASYKKISWKRPTNSVKITEYILLLDLFVDGVESYMASKCNNSLFVVNLMINNAPASERNTKAFSHFLAIIQDKRNIKTAMKYIIKDLCFTGKNGIYLHHDNHWMHIRWAISGVHGDTVAQEEMAELVNKKFMINPCIFDHTCECTIVSGSESLCVPPTTRSRFGQLSSWRLQPRNLRRFPVCSPYRFLSLAGTRKQCITDDTAIREQKALNGLLRYLDHPTIWIPPAVSTSTISAFRETAISSFLNQSIGVMDNSSVSKDELRKSSLDQIQSLYRENATMKKSVNPLCMDDYIPVPKENRYALDAMHHIPNVGICLYRALHREVRKESPFDTYLTEAIQKTRKDMYVPNWVLHIAMERIRLIRESWDNKGHEFVLDRMKGQNFDTTNQTPPPAWLKPSILTMRGFKKTRNHDDILFLLCYFDYVFQDSMRVPFVFAAKQVIDCLGYLYNSVDDLDKAANVQTILDFFVEFLVAIMPPSFGTITLHNSTHYLDAIKWFGPMKNHDCFGNERLLRLVKGNTVTSRNPIITVEKRLFRHEECQIILRAKRELKSSCVVRDENYVENDTRMLNPNEVNIKEATLENLTDDKLYCLNDSTPFATSVDKAILGVERSFPINNSFLLKDEEVKYYTEVRFDGENCRSVIPGETIDSKWLKENSKAIGYLKLIDGTVALFIVTGYVVQKVDSCYYPLAICKYIETQSSSSFIDTQHKRICNKTYSTRDLKTCLISLYKLTMNRAFALYYEKSQLCGFALQSICSRQSKPVAEDQLFCRKKVAYNTRQHDNK